MAGCGQASRHAASRRRPTLCGLRAGAGASDNRTRVRAPAGAALSPLPPRGHAATANGARRSRAGRRGAAEGGADRAAGEYALGRCPVPEVVHLAPARPEGRPRRDGGRLRGNPVDAIRSTRRRTGTYIGGGDRDGEPGHVGRRRFAEGIEGTNDTAGGAVPPLRKAQGAVLPVHPQAAGQPAPAPRSLPPVPACAARCHAKPHALALRC